MLAACSDEPLTLLPTSAPGAVPRQLTRTGSRRHQAGRMTPPERRGRHKQEMLEPVLKCSQLCLTAAHTAEPSTHHPTKCCRRGRPMAPPAPSTPLSLFGPRVGASLQKLGRTVGAGKPGHSRQSPALWVGSGQGPPQAQAAPRGAAQLPPAVWKHVPCPALTQRFERRRVTELANSTVWKRWVCAHCRQDILTLWHWGS